MSPSPIEELQNLRNELKFGGRIFIKREDKLRPFFGHKIRYLEYLLGEYFARKHTSVIFGVSEYSNYSYQLASLCAEFGIKLDLVVKDKKSTLSTNLAAAKIFGANFHESSNVKYTKLELANSLRNSGENPLLVSYPLQNIWAYQGMSRCFDEINFQVKQASASINIDTMVVCSVWHSYVGLAVARDFSESNISIHMVSPTNWNEISHLSPLDSMENWVQKKKKEYQKHLGLPKISNGNSQQIMDRVVEYGPYGFQSKPSQETVRLIARLQGIALDPIYNAKSMAWILDEIRSGRFQNQDILFLYTGSFGNYFDFLDSDRSGNLR